MTLLQRRPSLGFAKKTISAIASSVLLLPSVGISQNAASSSEEIAALRARIDALEAQSAAPTPRASVTVGRRGFEAKSSDGAFSLRIRPRIQTDFIWFPDDDGTDSLTLRRLRPAFQGDAGPLSWRFMPELAGTVRILDAWGDIAITDDSYFRFGKAKGPIGLERLQSFSHTLFNERGLPSNLTPTRELGVQYFASYIDGKIDWSVGVFNGSLDDSDQSNNANLSSDLDYGARVFVHPFKGNNGAWDGLGFGMGVSTGTEDTVIADSDRDSRIRYRSSGRNTIFRYNDGVALDGERLRLNPSLYYYNGPFGFLSEYVLSSYEASRGGVSRTIDAEGFAAQASWVLTGENATYGYVRPKNPYSLGGDGKGAFEIGLRYHSLEIDEAAFAGDATTRLARNGSVQMVSAYGIAAKWYLTDTLLATINYEIADFSGIGASRHNEEIVHSRLQIDF